MEYCLLLQVGGFVFVSLIKSYFSWLVRHSVENRLLTNLSAAKFYACSLSVSLMSLLQILESLTRALLRQ